MFGSVLNTPLVFSLRGHFVKQKYLNGIRPRLYGNKLKGTKKISAQSVDNFLLHPLALKQNHIFFLGVDKISKLYSTSNFSGRSSVMKLRALLNGWRPLESIPPEIS